VSDDRTDTANQTDTATDHSADAAWRDRLQAVTQVMQAVVNVFDNGAAYLANGVVATVQPVLEPTTSMVGQVISPIVNLPFVRYATAIPGLRWLLAAVGQVNVAAVRSQVDDLRRQYPADDQRALARRVMADTTLKAAGVGLATNLAPPLALMLTLVDIGAVAALQANMIYRIATIYGYSPDDSDRRGEVLTIWLLSSSSSGLIKSGLSLTAAIPLFAAIAGVAADATVIYSVGYFACRYYETKAATPTEVTV